MVCHTYLRHTNNNHSSVMNRLIIKYADGIWSRLTEHMGQSVSHVFHMLLEHCHGWGDLLYLLVHVHLSFFGWHHLEEAAFVFDRHYVAGSLVESDFGVGPRFGRDDFDGVIFVSDGVRLVQIDRVAVQLDLSVAIDVEHTDLWVGLSAENLKHFTINYFRRLLINFDKVDVRVEKNVTFSNLIKTFYFKLLVTRFG